MTVPARLSSASIASVKRSLSASAALALPSPSTAFWIAVRLTISKICSGYVPENHKSRVGCAVKSPTWELPFIARRWRGQQIFWVGLALNPFAMEATLYELVFTVCSIVHGAHCSDLSPVPLEANTPLIACVIASQVEGAKWVFSHPNFYVQKVTCQPAGRFAKL